MRMLKNFLIKKDMVVFLIKYYEDKDCITLISNELNPPLIGKPQKFGRIINTKKSNI